MKTDNFQYLPRSGSERHELRKKGQFWTPPWIAEAMITFVLDEQSSHLFDPAVGPGIFFRAALDILPSNSLEFLGREIDKSVFDDGIVHLGLEKDIFKNIEIRDFILDPPTKKFDAIIANPPYIRHHLLDSKTKLKLREISENNLGFAIDGRAGLHIYFLIVALTCLNEGGKLAFIMPSDTCEGVFANDLWDWISSKFRLEAVITFAPDATPFPDVDTNPMIYFISKNKPTKKFIWVKCHQKTENGLRHFISNGYKTKDIRIEPISRELNEALATGLSRLPTENNFEYTLSDFANIIRGIATGNNSFFLLTEKEVEKLKIPSEYVKLFIGKTRNAKGDVFSSDDLETLDEKGLPTRLLAVDKTPLDKLPESLQDYLTSGEEQGVPNGALISQRNPWYKMEHREPPPILFTYLGRRNSRFILNQANVVPSTSFLCVYPKRNDPDSIRALWQLLNSEEVINNLKLVGKSYGSGAIKVEPGGLRKLPIPTNALFNTNLINVAKKIPPRKDQPREIVRQPRLF